MPSVSLERDDAACSSIELSAHTQRYEFAAYVCVGRRGKMRSLAVFAARVFHGRRNRRTNCKRNWHGRRMARRNQRTKWTDRDDMTVWPNRYDWSNGLSEWPTPQITKKYGSSFFTSVHIPIRIINNSHVDLYWFYHPTKFSILLRVM